MPGELYCGDNLEVMRSLPSRSVDLAYLDPPFFSGRQYRSLDDQKRTVFSDSWSFNADATNTFDELVEQTGFSSLILGLEKIVGRSSLLAYLLFLIPRISEVKRLLRDSGSIYVHCDGSASGYIRIILDAVFGRPNYLTTVVWCYGLGGSTPKCWPRKHDDIHWYAVDSSRHYFDPPTEPAKSNMMKGKQKKVPDYWMLPSLNNMANERTGYPTQKPLMLLNRIVTSSCPPDGVVLDPFCGSGTTLVAASIFKRPSIGIDQNPEAIAMCRERLADFNPFSGVSGWPLP